MSLACKGGGRGVGAAEQDLGLVLAYLHSVSISKTGKGMQEKLEAVWGIGQQRYIIRV